MGVVIYCSRCGKTVSILKDEEDKLCSEIDIPGCQCKSQIKLMGFIIVTSVILGIISYAIISILGILIND
jgi:hypothetical protein